VWCCVSALIFEAKYANKKNNLAKRKFCNINLDCDLIKQIEIMATHLDKRQNELIEEAIQDLLKKYKDLDRPTEPSSTELLLKTLTKNT
jgi:metal-responsive CopG/Arc/MetJ family transcriptional regulator